MSKAVAAWPGIGPRKYTLKIKVACKSAVGTSSSVVLIRSENQGIDRFVIGLAARFVEK
jgi:hypothetical protein